MKQKLFAMMAVAAFMATTGAYAQFEKGNPRYVAGMSGTELADEVMRRVTGHGCTIESEPYYDRTEAYWTGFTLAWYQWYDNCSFRELIVCHALLGINDIICISPE